VNIEQFIKEAIQRRDRIADAPHQVSAVGVAHDVPQCCGEQPERMQGLAQVVAGSREEARLCGAGLLGGRTGDFHLL
jgi:hypothetical protein